MQLIVIVKKLNKRTLVPANLPDPSNIIGVVHEGFRFEGVEADVTEVPNPMLGKWFKDRDGFFYWGGGLTEMFQAAPESPTAAPDLFEVAEVAEEIAFDQAKMSWGHQFYNIPIIWSDLGTMGKGVTVAVIDTGIDTTHADLVSNIHPKSKSLIGTEDDIIDRDPNHHGTRMAGIIAGSGKNKIFGVAPESKVLIVKATMKKIGADVNLFTDAVKFVTSIPEVDIVSISYTLKDKPLFKEAIQKCIDANKIIVAAIGNLRDNDIPVDPDTFPSCYNSGINNTLGNEVIAVGAFDQQKAISVFSNFNPHLSCIAPGESILTANAGNGSVLEDGTSIATAFMAGCLALMVSFGKTHNKTARDCAKAVLNSCEDLGPAGHDSKSGFGFLDLKKAISKIK
jgi:major intracellular serine protease